MHIWLVNPYGTLPAESWREYRTVLAARALLAAGHTVSWWVGNFVHRSKEFRTHDWEVRPLFPGFTAVIVPTTGYQRHISLARIRYEQTFAQRVREQYHRAPKPDLIVLAEPALFTSAPIIALAREMDVPLMLDVGDLWPELFQIGLPRQLRPLGRLLFAPLYRRRADLLKRSAGYVAVTRDYLALMQSIAPRTASAVVYWGVDVAGVREELTAETPLPSSVSNRAKRSDDVWVVYAGTLGPNYDIRTILAAAEILQGSNQRITIFIAGDGASCGELITSIQERKLTNCVFLGLLPAATVAKLYSVCDVALSSYVGDSTVSMPIKAFDYFAAGLPIVNSLGRDLEHFVTTRDVGLQYEPENPVALAGALRRLASDSELRSRMARNADRLGAEFDWRIQYAGFVTVAEEIRADFLAQRGVSEVVAT